jgi:RNA polymerase sigma factor (sigma-70 family)
MKISPEQHPELTKILSGDIRLLYRLFYSIISKGFHALKAKGDLTCLADEICHDSYVDILVNYYRGKLPKVTNEIGFVYTIIFRKIVNEYRRDNRIDWQMFADIDSGDIKCFDPTVLVNEITPEGLYIVNERNFIIREGLGILCPKYESIVSHYYWMDLSCQEIAEIFNITANHVRVNLYNARRRLKPELKKKLS